MEDASDASLEASPPQAGENSVRLRALAYLD